MLNMNLCLCVFFFSNFFNQKLAYDILNNFIILTVKDLGISFLSSCNLLEGIEDSSFVVIIWFYFILLNY